MPKPDLPGWLLWPWYTGNSTSAGIDTDWCVLKVESRKKKAQKHLMYVSFTPFAPILTYITTSLFKDRLNTKCFTRMWNMICADIAQSVLADEGDNCKLSYGLGWHKSGPQQQHCWQHNFIWPISYAHAKTILVSLTGIHQYKSRFWSGIELKQAIFDCILLYQARPSLTLQKSERETRGSSRCY